MQMLFIIAGIIIAGLVKVVLKVYGGIEFEGIIPTAITYGGGAYCGSWLYSYFKGKK